MKSKFLFATAVIIVLALLASCNHHGKSKVGEKSDFFAMNTYISVFTEESIPDLHNGIRELTLSLEKLFTSKSPDAALLKYYQFPEIYKDHQDLLLLAHDVAVSTDGAFDYTLGTLTSLWDVTGNPRVPLPEDIKAALSNCGYKFSSVKNGQLSLENKDTVLDLGAVAKGYCGDRITELMRNSGVSNGYVSLGGNITVTGSSQSNIQKGKTGWSVAINNPFDTSAIIGTLDIYDSTVSVSGSYERFFEEDGIHYHHIFDAKTGYPAHSDIVSVAVICENGALADALSTALFVMGYENAIDFYTKKIYDFEAVFTLSAGDVYVTEGIFDRFIPSYNGSKDGVALRFPQYD